MPRVEALGIDIGGTGIKAARVDTDQGDLLTERMKVSTPSPSTPEAVAAAVAELAKKLDWKGPAGCGFPGVIHRGKVLTAANISKDWLGVRADTLLEKATGCELTVANDADLAGLAEMRFGAGKGREGVVLMLTFGTGIGTAIFVDGKLVPNTELGHLEIDGHEAEKWASERARIEKELSWKKWGKRVTTYLERMHAYFWPELIIFGGGVSRKFDKLAPHLSPPCEVVPAKLQNRAGVIGAAVAAAEGLRA